VFYKGRELRSYLEPLTEFFYLSSCAGPAVGQVLYDLALQRSIPSDHQAAWLENGLQFCALCCARSVEVVDFDNYLGEFYVDQFDSYELEWPEGEENQPVRYLETSYDLQATGFQLNFVDLLLTRLCQDYITAMQVPTHAPHGQISPLLQSLLDIRTAPSFPSLIEAIDLALYQAGVPLKNERYERTDPGDFGLVHTWPALAFDVPSDTGQAMPPAAYDVFTEMRKDVFRAPPGVSSQVEDDGTRYRIYLA
jgi:hypothetical protein